MSKVDLSDSKYATFLEKLASDDDFRASVKKDPGGALAAHGIDLDPSVAFKTKVKLPSKKDLRENLDSHIERMASLHAMMSYVT